MSQNSHTDFQILLLLQHLSDQQRKIAPEFLRPIYRQMRGKSNSAFTWARSNGLLSEVHATNLARKYQALLDESSGDAEQAVGQLLACAPQLRHSSMEFLEQSDPMATEFESPNESTQIPWDPNATLEHDVPGVEPHTSTVVQRGQSKAETNAGGSNISAKSKGRYLPIRFHAQGGLGEIHIAQDEELNREVALKEIRSEYVDDLPSRDRFVIEGEVTGRLEHPGIVPVYGMGTDASGRPFYAMRFIKGQTLSERIREYHGLGAEEKEAEESNKASAKSRDIEFQSLLRQFMSICRTMDYAHSRGVLHRDLKPDNIMLGRYEETLILDWGLAKIIGRKGNLKDAPETTDAEKSLHPGNGSDPNQTARGSVAGTLLYMSPEQALGWHDRLAPTADVFSLGAILFELLTGRNLYVARTVESAQKKAVECIPESPREVRPDLPKALAAICLKATAKEPQDRYQSAGDLADDIAAHLADQPVTAKRDSVVERCGRWARKNRTLVSTAVAAGIVALITLGSTSVLLSKKNQEIAAKNDEVIEQRDRAEQNLKLARGAVRDLLANLSEDPRLEAAGLDSLRLKLAEKATPYFQEFLEATPDDEEVAFEQVQLRKTLGEISFQASSQETAYNYFKAISDSLDQLLASNPESEIALTYRQIMARTQDRLGVLHSYWGEADLAQNYFERALEIAEALPPTPGKRP